MNNRAVQLGLLVLLFMVAIALLVSLGVWQLQRGELKSSRYEQFSRRLAEPTVDYDLFNHQTAPEDRLWRQVRLVGQFDNSRLLLDNRTRQGQIGYEVFAPFVTNNGLVVLVARRWIRQPATRDTVPPLIRSSDQVEIRGYIGGPPATGLRFNAQSDEIELLDAATWRSQRIDLERLSGLWNKPLSPDIIYLVANDKTADFTTGWPMPGDGSARHRAYAVQWFAMAAVLFLIGCRLWLKRKQADD